MFEASDYVETVTDDRMNGLFGEVVRVGFDEHEGDYAILILDEDREFGLETYFLFSELRKVEA
jgi:hypothetical protein